MRLAVETPIAYPDLCDEWTDIDFLLAHEVLDAREDYINHFRRRPDGRELILDNGFHELGKPVDLTALSDAAERVKPDLIVCPDELDRPGWGREQIESALRFFPPKKLMVVVNGETAERRAELFRIAASSGIKSLGFPFKRPRLAWFNEARIAHAPLPERIHLLGMSTLGELGAWLEVEKEVPEISFSIDTAKPVKAGLVGKGLAHGEDLRGLMASSAMLSIPIITPSQLHLIKSNLSWMRRFLSGDSTLSRPNIRVKSVDWQEVAERLGHASPKDMFAQLYLTEGQSLEELHEYFGVPKKALRRLLPGLGITLRSRGGPNNRKIFLSDEELVRIRLSGNIQAEAEIRGISYSHLYALVHGKKKTPLKDRA